jgi:hypothetical protein
MTHLEKLYDQVILTEKLRVLNLTPDIIEKELNKQYPETAKQFNNVSYKPREDDKKNILELLQWVSHMDKSYTSAFLKYKTNPNMLKKVILNTDFQWKNFYNKLPRQASNLVIIKLLAKMGLKIDVTYNDAGLPVYKLHLLNRYIQMNILKQLAKHKEIDDDTKKQLESIIFDETTQKQLKSEIENYYKESDVENTSELETPTETPPNPDQSSAYRIEMIRKMLEK